MNRPQNSPVVTISKKERSYTKKGKKRIERRGRKAIEVTWRRARWGKKRIYFDISGKYLSCLLYFCTKKH